MRVSVSAEPSCRFGSLHELIRLAFPGWDVKEGGPEPAEARVSIMLESAESGQILKICISDEHENLTYSEPLAKRALPGEPEDVNTLRKAVRAALFKALCQYRSAVISPYGLLTGMRPVKAAHRLLDRLSNPEDLEDELAKEYLMTEDKARLVAEIALTSRPLLGVPADEIRLPAVYIGIPFCPSRCYYCSFPGSIMKDYDRDISPFLDCLHREIDAVSHCFRSLSLHAESVYIGGGTPSILTEGDLDRLLTKVRSSLCGPSTREMSIEAGRPDSLNPEKLRIMQQHGINRICINPQSMHDDTLMRIGRRHTAREVEEMVEASRLAGFTTINMDLIAGLEGEDQDRVIETAARILKLRPENITVHSLAVKRGSALATSQGMRPFGNRGGDAERAVRHLESCFRAAGYLPYYMYRQKYTRDNSENIGYSLPGHFCLYNIRMIEEGQTIIGLGGAAASKFVGQNRELLGVFYNPKDPYYYIRDIERLIQSKVDKLEALF